MQVSQLLTHREEWVRELGKYFYRKNCPCQFQKITEDYLYITIIFSTFILPWGKQILCIRGLKNTSILRFGDSIEEFTTVTEFIKRLNNYIEEWKEIGRDMELNK